MYVAMIHLNLHQEWMKCIERNLIKRIFLSHETHTKHQKELEKKLFFSETWDTLYHSLTFGYYYFNVYGHC